MIMAMRNINTIMIDESSANCLEKDSDGLECPTFVQSNLTWRQK
ncbi:MAG: hypothetical protein ACD_39C00246G0003 [uncultured bacterium]|nr:MAG: hypothetical protein ACD_39C00246G0003 [uncultured bacterium]